MTTGFDEHSRQPGCAARSDRSGRRAYARELAPLAAGSKALASLNEQLAALAGEFELTRTLAYGLALSSTVVSPAPSAIESTA